MASSVGDAAMACRALWSWSSSTSSPRADSTCDNALASTPSPSGTGSWGRYPTVPSLRISPEARRWLGVAPRTKEISEDLPAPLRPTRPTLSLAPIRNVASRTSVRPPISMVMSRPLITSPFHHGYRWFPTTRCMSPPTLMTGSW